MTINISRLFLGPYAGRPVALKQEIAGILTNPNCEYEANFVALHTLAQWNQSDADANVEDGWSSFHFVKFILLQFPKNAHSFLQSKLFAFIFD